MLLAAHHCMAGLQRDRYLCGQDTPRSPIHDGGKVDEAFGHWDEGRVQCQDLVGPIDGKVPQQLRINLVARVLLAGSILSI